MTLSLKKASLVKGQSLQQKETKRRKREGEKNSKSEKPKDVGFLCMPEPKGHNKCFWWQVGLAVVLQIHFRQDES